MRWLNLGLSVVLSWAAFAGNAQMCFAAATEGDIRAAIQSSHALDAAARFTVKIDGDKVLVGISRDPRENDKDRLINTVLIARAVLQAAGDSVARISAYWYGRDVSKYQEVSVSAGDIKAFATGQTTQEQLLSGLSVVPHNQENATERVARQLENEAYNKPDYKVALNNNNAQLAITTPLGAWVPDQELMVEALRVANNAVAVAPKEVREIKIAFADPKGTGPTRELTFAASNVPTLWQTVQGEFRGVQIAKVAPTVDLQKLQVASGAMKEERTQLLNRLKEMEKKGVTVAPFVKAFQALEQQVGDEAALKASIDKLNKSLDEQQGDKATAPKGKKK